ncbi:Agp2p [Sugiyamaella lignohabitans]|uniref:Agp2p n=1 Tax=Sugiyamaella lignohabitans TaxID=796027 RepID=A0A167CUE2_9ASCO|nr:Agp2p [Sugiyamaella lignohabitans]ANB12115.1 Agp2p [Sugiyamaella lignohabitans]
MIASEEKSVGVTTAIDQGPSGSQLEETLPGYPESISSETPPPSYHSTHRKLKSRHIQLIGIGGTIGTVLFVQLGSALSKGGPGSLFLAFFIWCFPILCITNSTAEMVTYLPLPSPFIRLAGRCVDPALEVMAGWNFFILEATLVPFEITAVNIIIHFWADGFSPAIPIVVQIFLYVLINFFAVRYYGESEFWLSFGKVLLAVGLIVFTFVTMVGGNPKHDAYGFRYWQNPGAFAEYQETGSLGRFLGFFTCLVQACYTISGPEYVSMAAGEAENPRGVMPRAYRGVIVRLVCFFVFGALSMGIVCPYNDPELLTAINTGAPGAAASPYIIAMQRLGIPVLPHIVNVLVLTASFSAGNSYVYCASRSLYGMALDGHAPKIFSKCTKNGVPIYAVTVVLAFGLLSFLQLGNTAETVLNWIVNISTASELINFAIMSLTYLRFYYAMKAQNMSRDNLPYKGPFQPYCGYIGLICAGVMTFLSGYSVFVHGYWSLSTFICSYIMIAVDLVIYVSWKLVKRTKIRSATEIDLLSDVKEIEDYTSSFVDEPPKTLLGRISRALIG